MAHSSDDTDDYDIGHLSKPLNANSDVSFTDEEKEAIASLALIKHKPVLFKCSGSRKEESHHAGHAQVEANISSYRPQMVNHNIRLSNAQVEAPSGFPVEIENSIAGFPNWRGSDKQLYKQKKCFEFRDKDESEELFLGYRKNEFQKDIGYHLQGYHGASADDNSIENPNVCFNWRGSNQQISKEKKEYFKLKDKDESDVELFLGIRKDNVFKDIGHHGASADNNSIENPNARFSNWKESSKQMSKQTKDFELKDKGQSKDELFQGIRKDKAHKDISHHGARSEGNSIENPNVGFSRKQDVHKDIGHHGASAHNNSIENPNARFSNWKGSHKQMSKQTKDFKFKDKGQSKDELFLGIRKDKAHKDISHHDARSKGNGIETPNVGFSRKHEVYKDICHHGASADDNSIENLNARISNRRGEHFEFKEKDKSEDEFLLGFRKDEVPKSMGHHGASVDDNDIENPNAKFSNWRGFDRPIYKKKKSFSFKDKDKSEDELFSGIRKNENHKDIGHHGASVDNNCIENPNAGFYNRRDSDKQIYKQKKYSELKDKDELFLGIRKDEAHKDIGHHGASIDDIGIENPNAGFSFPKGSDKQIYKKKKSFELKDKVESEDKLVFRIRKDEAHKDIGHHGASIDDIGIENPNAGFSFPKDSDKQIYKKNKSFELKDKVESEDELVFRIRKDEAHKDIGHHCASADDKDEYEDEELLILRRDEVHKDTGHHDGTADDNSLENPKTRVSNEGADINDNNKRVRSKTNRNGKGGRGRPRRRGQAIGVCDYQRSGRYEANIWLRKEKRQIHLGQYFIPEAAARCSDKAMLVTRLPAERNLNYLEADYDMRLIEEWRQVFNNDVNKFADILREQSKKCSEGCVTGLNDEAALELLYLIEEKKIAEASENNG